MPDQAATKLSTPAIDDFVQSAIDAWQAPGIAVAIVSGDEVPYLKGFGVRELGKPDPMTPDTLFAIGSTTKAFVTAAMAILVDEGKMAWDDPVRKHIEYFRLSDPLADANVTLRDLVCHRTGLSRHDMLWYGSPWSREEILRKVAWLKPSSSFRSRWEYQNIMFMAAGYAVGLAAGSTWEQFTQERILDPLGMSGACFSTTDAEKAPDHASPHQKKDDAITSIPWRNLDNVGPAGSINAGARDLSKWIRLQLGGGEFEGVRLISAASLLETHAPQMALRMDDTARKLSPSTQTSYSLGWNISDYCGNRIVSHGGGIDGFRAQVALVPDRRLGLAIVSNLGGNNLPEALLNSLIALILDLPRNDWIATYREQEEKSQAEAKAREKEREEKRHQDTQPALELSEYAGAYVEPAYGVTSIALENGGLVLQWGSFTKPLVHYQYETFMTGDESPFEKQQIVFRLGADGNVDAMQLLGVEFVRRKADQNTSA